MIILNIECIDYECIDTSILKRTTGGCTRLL